MKRMSSIRLAERVFELVSHVVLDERRLGIKHKWSCIKEHSLGLGRWKFPLSKLPRHLRN